MKAKCCRHSAIHWTSIIFSVNDYVVHVGLSWSVLKILGRNFYFCAKSERWLRFLRNLSKFRPNTDQPRLPELPSARLSTEKVLRVTPIRDSFVSFLIEVQVTCHRIASYTCHKMQGEGLPRAEHGKKEFTRCTPSSHPPSCLIPPSPLFLPLFSRTNAVWNFSLSRSLSIWDRRAHS